ncbi:MAG: SDR family NAD(P)-dependent oxidoreductase [Gammaproteobacteria bacterium]
MGHIIDHRVLIITGGSRGIGLATIKQFAKNNWRIINLSRKPCDITGVTNIEIDLQHVTRSLEHLKQLLAAELGDSSMICLVHNAGMYISDTVAEQSAETARALLEINVVAPIILNQIVIPLMAAGSSIIYLGSTLSEKAVPHSASYVVSKHAVAGLMRATCQDLAGRNIHTCCVCPGVTETEMLKERCDHAPGLMDTLVKMSAYHRLVKPEELADLIWFCAHHPIINGSILHGNLGQIER